MQYEISQVILLRFGENPLKMDNVIKRMNRTTLTFGAKIILFTTYTDYFLQKF